MHTQEASHLLLVHLTLNQLTQRSNPSIFFKLWVLKEHHKVQSLYFLHTLGSEGTSQGPIHLFPTCCGF